MDDRSVGSGSISALWALLGGDPTLVGRVEEHGARRVLAGVFDVTGFAASTVGVATLAAAELLAARSGSGVPPVRVDRRGAAAAFLSEHLFTPIGWERPAIWDALAGDYRASDGWIRLHTNYRSHRDATLRALGLEPGSGPDREVVAAAVARRPADELEQAVIDARGCAAVMRTRSAWLATPAGRATAADPPVEISASDPIDTGTRTLGAAARPLDGVRVLDLTRVIAGPVCTRFLAAYGADVLRVDPPGFEEVPAAVPDTTVGKRCCVLDLRADDDRVGFVRLVGQADVVVTGLRPGAMWAMGFAPDDLRRINPRLVTVTLDAYGWHGPWRGRRGFDSLVQMSTGIAAIGAEDAGIDRPVPLPAQALDHGTGYLLAAATCRALTRLVTEGRPADVRGALVGSANVLIDGRPDAADPGDPAESEPERPAWGDGDTVPVSTAWGPARRVPNPGVIDGVPSVWTLEAGPLGRHAPSFAVP